MEFIGCLHSLNANLLYKFGFASRLFCSLDGRFARLITYFFVG